jgi:murein DD-endopeptidase MepM/ murein hydrolase activator NlpD
MSRRQANIMVALLLFVGAASAYRFPEVRAAVIASTPTAWLRSTPDPVNPDAARGEQTQRGWHAIATPYPTPRATPVKPPKPPKPIQATVRATVQVPSASLIWPLRGRITTYYSAVHPAIDIAAPLGTPVKAACSGRVAWAGWKNNGGGYVVDVRCTNGVTVSNNHLSAVLTAFGAGVGQGQLVGLVGMTGHATGPHLHLAVIVAGRFVNPLAYLP